jgi:hypothetical protein
MQKIRGLVFAIEHIVCKKHSAEKMHSHLLEYQVKIALCTVGFRMQGIEGMEPRVVFLFPEG